jgi:hypothetical protein
MRLMCLPGSLHDSSLQGGGERLCAVGEGFQPDPRSFARRPSPASGPIFASGFFLPMQRSFHAQ